MLGECIKGISHPFKNAECLALVVYPSDKNSICTPCLTNEKATMAMVGNYLKAPALVALPVDRLLMERAFGV